MILLLFSAMALALSAAMVKCVLLRWELSGQIRHNDWLRDRISLLEKRVGQKGARRVSTGMSTKSVDNDVEEDTLPTWQLCSDDFDQI